MIYDFHDLHDLQCPLVHNFGLFGFSVLQTVPQPVDLYNSAVLKTL